MIGIFYTFLLKFQLHKWGMVTEINKKRGICERFNALKVLSQIIGNRKFTYNNLVYLILINSLSRKLNFAHYMSVLNNTIENRIEQKGMNFDHDFGYSFPLFSSLPKKGGRRKGE